MTRGPRLAELISESGASTNEERDGIGQLLLSVGRQFLQIERALDNVAKKIGGVPGPEVTQPSARLASSRATFPPASYRTSQTKWRRAAGRALFGRVLSRFAVDLRCLSRRRDRRRKCRRTLRKVVRRQFVLGPLTGPGGMSLKLASGRIQSPASVRNPKPGLGTDPKPGLLEVDPKPGLLDTDPKPGLLDTDPKPGLLDTDPKPGLRELIFGGASSAMVGSVELFGLIGLPCAGLRTPWRRSRWRVCRPTRLSSRSARKTTLAAPSLTSKNSSLARVKPRSGSCATQRSAWARLDRADIARSSIPGVSGGL